MKVFHTAIYYEGSKSSRFPLFPPGDLLAKLQQKLFLHSAILFHCFLSSDYDRDPDFMSSCLQTPNTTACSPLVILCQTNPSSECFDASSHATLWFSSCAVVHRGRLVSSAPAQCHRRWSFHNIFLLSTSTIITRTTSDFSFFHLKIY